VKVERAAEGLHVERLWNGHAPERRLLEGFPAESFRPVARREDVAPVAGVMGREREGVERFRTVRRSQPALVDREPAQDVSLPLARGVEVLGNAPGGEPRILLARDVLEDAPDVAQVLRHANARGHLTRGRGGWRSLLAPQKHVRSSGVGSLPGSG
jgi:hypothetical protein